MKNDTPPHDTSLTSIKVFSDKYLDFKRTAAGDFTLQKLVNRSMYLYIHDPEYRKLIQSINDLKVSGSSY
jgi:hypothetical protein